MTLSLLYCMGVMERVKERKVVSSPENESQSVCILRRDGRERNWLMNDDCIGGGCLFQAYGDGNVVE